MLPYVEVKGTPKAMGLAIGEHLQKDIASALSRFENHLTLSPRAITMRMAHLWRVAKKYFPDYVEEVEGIAEGSGQMLNRIIRFNFEEELAYFKHCSTLAVHTGRTIFLGHNEDWEHPMPLYVVKAKPKKGPAFISLSYAGQLPGTSVGFNEAGLAFGNNSISTKLNFSGLPKIYCLRNMLASRSLDAIAENLSRHTRSAGNACTVVYGGQLYLLEWSPNKIAVESCRPWIAHANRYMMHGMQHEQLPASRGTTSKARHERMWEMLIQKEVRSAEDMKLILSDHENKLKSICRHAKNDMTIASAIVDIGRSELQVAYGNPCNVPYRKYTL